MVPAFKANGVEYYAPLSNEANAKSPVRMVTDVAPIKVDSPSMSCGPNAAKSASQIANVTAGSTVEFGWRSGSPPTPWPHLLGPVMTYMAKCPGAATDCDGASIDWFKIDQQGFLPSTDGKVHLTQELFHDGKTTIAVVPKGLASGDYLIRHEIIALHLATALGGAEFYPMCTQVAVQGSGSGVPSPTVSFPGAYSDTDPGIYDPDVRTISRHA